jgi:tetratricopeptide (TPR) repeat protein
VREAYGLGLYRTGAFTQARTELAAAQRLSGTADLSALLADIERALGRPEKALELFEQADRASMSDDAAAELLIVAASAYGDLDRPATGVALIRRHGGWPQQLRDHHLRLAYAQGLLAEQAGDGEAARTAFGRVVAADPDYFDAAERLDRLEAAAG